MTMLDKIIERLRQEGEMDIREFRRSISLLRLTNNDIDEIIKDMVNKKMVKIKRNSRKPSTISMKG